MPQAIQIVRKAAVRSERVADTVTLTHAERAAVPAFVTSEAGVQIAVALERPGALNDGDALKLADGGLIQVRAAAEKLLEIRAENPVRLLKTAWQLGGHHVPAEILGDALYVEDDAAVAELVRGQGCSLTPVSRPFQPEQSAHVHGPDCGHDHHHHGHDHHDHGHSHAHAHSEAHAHSHHDHAHEHHHGKAGGHADAHAHAHSDAHTDGCGCGHHHDHGHAHGAAHGHKGHTHDH